MSITHSIQPTGLWSRLKRYGATAIGNTEDFDGDTEEDTHVHRVLVQYYLERYGYVPTFLGGGGPPTTNQYQQQQQSPLQRQRVAAAMPGGFANSEHHPQQQPRPPQSYNGVQHAQYPQQNLRQPPLPNTANTAAGSPSRRSTPKPSLQDIYQRSQPSSVQPSSSSMRASFDTVDSRRSSGESRVRDKLQRRRVDPSAPSAGQPLSHDSSQQQSPLLGQRRKGQWSR
ncbi:uncharacterized protein V2V93DRAFT_227298 [Kockiozyma suomiensis]|uniref:uncharacterized protein n=1 Tax=Kockiozyma suomiensis TaxID=1337062 RepID=UPI003343D88D